MMQPERRDARAEPTMAALGSAAFQELAEREVAPDESFFHHYYKVPSFKALFTAWRMHHTLCDQP